MIVDTSVWVDHFRRGNRRLMGYLGRGIVHIHPFIIGELACGNLGNREELLSLLRSLPLAQMADDGEAHQLLSNARLHGRGIGWVDVHLLASALLSATSLWTLDRRLGEVASELGL